MQQASPDQNLQVVDLFGGPGGNRTQIWIENKGFN
jgi:hypothetical protein